jgi:hypothetical protein
MLRRLLFGIGIGYLMKRLGGGRMPRRSSRW